jgi:hypothetical protein
MNISALGKQAVRAALARVGLSIRRIAHEEKLYVLAGHDPAVPLPPGAESALRYDNPRLLELERRYQAVDSPVCQHTQWRAELRPQAMDLRYFRGDNAYMWQYRRTRDFTRLRYYLYARYVRELDHRQLLGRVLTEDGQFGCFTFRFDEMPAISRDLLDSINELYFLDRHWNVFGRRGARVLDIGAGYGRLAHRMLTATDSVERYWCIDAIPRSTFLCEYYLGHRGCLADAGGRAVVVPLDEMETSLQPAGVDLAVNIHSFSEMSYAAVEGWIQWLERLEVPHLMVIPNEPEMLSKEADGTRRSYRPVIERAGYRLVAQEPTIQDNDVRKLFGVADFMFLFAREAGPA